MSELDNYRSLYVDESRENHETIVKNLLILENSSDPDAIADIFRSAHSLKGMSASMGFVGMEQLCHAMEDVFQEIRSGNIELHPDQVNLLLAASDDIETMINDVDDGGDGILLNLDERVSALKKLADTGNETDYSLDNSSVPSSDTGITESSDQMIPYPDSDVIPGSHRYLIEIQFSESCDNLNLRAMLILQNLEEVGQIEDLKPSREIIEDGVFDKAIQIEILSDAGEETLEMIAAGIGVLEVNISKCDKKPETEVPSPAEHEELVQPKTAGKNQKIEKNREIKNIRVDINRLDHMMNLIEDLVINRGRITQISSEYNITEMDETLSMITRSVSDLQNLMINIRMIPLNLIFNRFPRTVRDIAVREGKDVEFIIEGAETELDRSVMDGLNDPLLHLIRNAIDHGIELPEYRKSIGKPPQGVLRLSARRDRENVIISLEDDGAGIDSEKIKAKALKNKLTSPEAVEEMTRKEICNFLFLPGFSTAETISDISGRGVGLDVVKNAIEAINGSINIESTPGKGTKFELILPPTLAIVNVMMVRINGHRCAIPITNVIEIASMSACKIHIIGSKETIMLRDEVLPLERLDGMFGQAENSETLIVLQNQDKKRSFAVDMVEGQQEVVIKPLSNIVGSCRGISGITIPGDGEVVPVLDVNSIFKEI